MKPKMMACGCRGMAKNGSEDWCITHDCGRAIETPDLSGRTAKCFYCVVEKPSAVLLPFFSMNVYKKQNKDGFYCGCRGWE
jgi:hypothetical protein